MDPPDYAFLKSGRGMPGAADVFTAAEAEAFTRRATSMAAVMTRRAAEVAATVADHHGARVVTKADVTAALKYQAMHVLHSEGLEEEVVEAERELYATGSDAEDSGDDSAYDDSAYDSEESETEEEESETEEEESEDTDSAYDENHRDAGGEKEEIPDCVCETCTGVRAAVAAWATWDPSDVAEAYLKKAVTEAEIRCSNGE